MSAVSKIQSSGIVIETGARLHFGLLRTTAPFGGVGVMIDRPATKISVRSSDTFSCDGPCADRLLAIATRFTAFLGESKLPACQISVLDRPEPHTGLGTGTQLAMAVADALCKFCQAEIPTEVLATQIAGRGKRSAIGVHGYRLGGLIYEESCDSSDQAIDSLNEVRHQVDLPSGWTVVIARPKEIASAVFGSNEQEQFNALAESDHAASQVLRAIATERIVTAAEQGCLSDFADAVHEYNRRSGMLFADVQGGPYNGPFVSKLVERMIDAGALGVGQSSWGPSVFSWFESRHAADEFTQRFDASDCELLITGVCNSTT